MITTLGIKNFKSLRDVRLELGKLNFFIGTNASGKSNVFDAIRVLQGIGNGFTFGEILDGKPKSATSEVWEPIRGGSAKAAFIKEDPSSSFQLEATVEERNADTGKLWKAEYGVGFNTGNQRVIEEWLTVGRPVYDSRPLAGPIHHTLPQTDPRFHAAPTFDVKYFHGKKGAWPNIPSEHHRAVLTQMARRTSDRWAKNHVIAASRLSGIFANTQRLDPSPPLLREYSRAQNVSRMGERGENFAALIRTICEDPGTKDAYLTWLKHLRPAEVDDIGILKGAVGELMFKLEENRREFPAPVLSDGTLRFAAITAAFFQPDMPSLLTLEEIENGIHANRLRLLVELLRNRTQTGQPQVVVTTHSPIVLAWLQPGEYAHTFFCKRDEQTGESRILPLTEIPHFNDTVKRQPIGDLFTEGWLEAAL
ncbi:MAG: AAA family ATPase [Opitutaceae bacterium]|jgi:predicted ATPase|nr:AAA family ATPase [Opitutaceae bacterium]